MAKYGITTVSEKKYPNIYKELKKQKRFSGNTSMALLDHVKSKGSGFPEPLGAFGSVNEAKNAATWHATRRLKSKKVTFEIL